LTAKGRELGLVDDRRWELFVARREVIAATLAALGIQRIEGVPALDWLRRTENSWAALVDKVPEYAAIDAGAGRQVEIHAKYAGYIARQDKQVERFAQMEGKLIPAWVDYATVTGLRNEARQKLTTFTPRSLGQAMRISGITPADVAIVAVHMEKPRAGTRSDKRLT
jgi:tRNA uridine 5-carboxymethylaminomethyl modification enzyme